MGRIDFSVQDGIAVVMLDNPAKRNAVDAEMRAGLTEAYTRIRDDDGIRVAVIRGAGDKAFCSGGDIDGYQEHGAFGPEGAGPPPIPRPWPIWKPFIAAVQGHAVGGGFALALACDLRVVGRGAQIGPTGLWRGAVQGAQQSQRLTRLIGLSKALELLLLARTVSGEEAAAMGLAQRVVDDEQVVDAAMEWARTIAGYSPWAVARTKELAYLGQDMPLDEAFAWEAEVAAEGYRRTDAVEGFTAFAERRDPRFS
jgi:enoyl-CoA hydratase/carnithine racemase